MRLLPARVCSLWSAASPALQPAPPLSFDTDRCASTTSTPVARNPARRLRSTASSTTARGRAAGRSSSTRRNLGHYLFEVRDVASGALSTRRGFASIYGEWETTSEAKKRASDLPRVGALPVAASHRCASRSRDGSGQHVRARSGPRGRSWVAVRQRAIAGARRHRLERVRERAGAEGKSTCWCIGEGYTQAELPKFHDDVKRLVDALFAQEPFKRPARRLQCAGAGLAVGRERRQPPECRRVPPHAAVGGIQHLRLRALRPHARQPRVARRRVGRAVRVHRDPGQRADLRRRRHLQRSGDRLGRQRVLPTTSSSTSSAITSRRWPTSTTRPMSRTRPARRRSRNRGSRTSPRCRSGRAEMARSRHARHAPADAVGEGGVRAAHAGDPGAPAGDPQAQRARNRDGRALSRAAGVRGEAPGAGRTAAPSAHSKAATTRRAGSTAREADCIMFTRDRVGFCRVCRRAITRIIDLYSK